MKKVLILAIAALTGLQAWAQTAISGTATSSKVYLLNIKGELKDSTAVQNGKFALQAANDQLVYVSNAPTLRGQDVKGVVLVCEGQPVEVDLDNTTNKGTGLNATLVDFQQQLNKLEDETAYNAFMKSQFEANKGNLVGGYVLANWCYDLSYEELKSMITPALPYYNNPVLDTPKRVMTSYEKRLPGTKISDIELKDPEGNSHKLSEYVGKGNYVLVDFWASWCPPCRKEMPNVKACYEQYHPKGFDIVGISLDRAEAAWKKGLEQLGMTWHQLSDLKYWQSEACSTYGINSIPATILVDPEGTIVSISLRGDELKAKLAEIYDK